MLAPRHSRRVSWKYSSPVCAPYVYSAKAHSRLLQARREAASGGLPVVAVSRKIAASSSFRSMVQTGGVVAIGVPATAAAGVKVNA